MKNKTIIYLFLFTLALATAHADNLTTNLTHYWKLDSNGNDTVSSLSLTPTNVTFQNTIAKINYSAYLMTVGGATPTARAWLDAGNSTNWNLANNNFTINLWYYRNDTTTNSQQIFTSGDAFDGADQKLTMEGVAGSGLDTITFIRKNSTGTTASLTYWASTLMPVGSWYMVTYAYNGTDISLWINGTQVNSTTATGTLGTHTADSRACFGAAECNYAGLASAKGVLNGRLDEIAIYNGKALSSSEISALYNSGQGCGYENLTYSSTTCSAAPPPTPTNFTVFANNATGSGISSYTAQVTYSGTTTNFTGTSGTAITTFYNNASILANVTVTAGGYTTNTTLNHNTTTNLTVTLYPAPYSNFSITAKDNVTTNNLATFNATVALFTPINITFLQETANLSTAEGGLSTGNYTVIDSSPYFYINYSKPSGAYSATWQLRSGDGTSTTLNFSISSCFNAYTSLLAFRIYSNASAGRSTASCWNGTGYTEIRDYIFANNNDAGSANTARLYDADYTTYSFWNDTAQQWRSAAVGGAGGGAEIYEEGIYWVANVSNFSYNTTTSQINTSINQSLGYLANITVSAPNYITSTYLNWNTSVNLTANLTPQTLITLLDSYTNAPIANANITYQIGGTTYTTNSSGQVFMNLTSNGTNITAQANNYFNRTHYNHTLGTNVTLYLYQSWQSFNATNLITGAAITTFTVTTTNQTNTSTNPVLLLGANTYSVTFNKTGYYNLTQSITTTALSNNTTTFHPYNTILNITAQNALTNETLTSFTTTATYLTYSDTQAASNNESHLNWTPTNNVLIVVNATGYAIGNITVNVTATGYANYTLYLSPTNSVDVNIYDQTTLALINTTNVTVTITSNNYTQSNVTSNGTFFVSSLEPNDYVFTFNATGYGTVLYAVTVTDQSTQTLNAYLVSSGSLVDFTTIDDNTGQAIEGVLWTIQRVIGANYTTVASLYSDIAGMVEFSYVPLVQYRFVLTANGYNNLTFTLNPIIQSTYTVRLEPSFQFNGSQDYSRISLLLTPRTFVNAQVNTLNLTIFSPYSELISYTLSATYPIGSGTYNTTATSGSTATGGTLSIPFNITTSAVLDAVNVTYTYNSTATGYHRFYFSYPIQNVTATGLFTNIDDPSYGMGAFERILIVTLVAILVVGVSFPFVGGLGAGLAGILILGLFAYSGFIPVWAVIISIATGFSLIAFWGARQ